METTKTYEGHIDIMSMLPEEMEEFFLSIGEAKYRAKQLFEAVSRGLDIRAVTTFSKSLREKLADLCEYRMPVVRDKLISADGTVKYLFKLIDGQCVESVFMRYNHGNTLCISTQAGCRMGCGFCASTIGGKVRDLTPSEIYGQVVAAGADMGERVSNVVMMGIGEPLDNYENVIKALKIINNPAGINIGYRHISLSTCGVVDKIYKLAKEELPITLSVSLHAADDVKRSMLMPINKKWNIDTLLLACSDYFAATSRRISFEYALILGENDTEQEAIKLARLLNKYFRVGDGEPIHVNLIPVNPVAERIYKAPDSGKAKRFANTLIGFGINATVRRRLGDDISAACGQLRQRDISP